MNNHQSNFKLVLIIVITLCIVVSLLNAQNNETIKVIKDVPFKTIVCDDGQKVPLCLNIYKQGQSEKQAKPLIVFLHGGGFHAGEKEDPKIIALCERLCNLGYVTATVEYRTGIRRKNKECFVRAVLNGMVDTQDALNFLVKNRIKYAIDCEYIYLGGMSAGAIVALHYAYWDAHEIVDFLQQHKLSHLHECNSQIKKRIALCGLINCWGAIINPNWIANNNTAVVSVHGTKDRFAPYKKGSPCHMFWLPKIYGSGTIDKVAKECGIPSLLKAYKGMRHGHDSRSPYMDTTITAIQSFINCTSKNNCKQSQLYTLESLENSSIIK